MPRLHLRLLAFLFLFSAGASFAQVQTSTNVFNLTIKPATNSFLIVGTTNTLNVLIQNFTDFSNVTVTASSGTLNLNLKAGTGVNSNDFTVLFPTPTNLGPLTLLFTVQGIDLTATNLVPTPTNDIILSTNVLMNYQVVPRPINDNFSTALKVPALGGTVFGSNNFGSLETGEPKHGGDPTVASSVWWVWTPPVSESVLIDTAGSGFAPVLAVYTGSAVNALTPVASSTNDVVDSLPANVVFQTVAGQTYYIAVAGWDSTTNGAGQIELRVAPGHLPDTNAPQLTILSPEAEFVTATNRVVIQGVAKDNGFDDTGVASVFVVINGGKPALAFSAPHGVASATWTLPITLPIGTNSVTAHAVDLAGNVSASYSIVINYVFPGNTLFQNAVRLTGLSGTFFDNTTNAIAEVGGPLIAGNLATHTVWWNFLAPANGALSLTTSGSSFDTILGVFTGNNVTNLTAVAGNDDANTNVTYSTLVTAVTSNVLYSIAVDGYAGATGNVVLNFTFTPGATGTNPPPILFSVNAQAGTGGTVIGGGSYPSNSTVSLQAIAAQDYGFSFWQGGAGLGTSTSNPLVLPSLRSNQTWTAQFVLTNITDTFASGTLNDIGWVTAGAAAWFVQSAVVPTNATFAAQSGPIGDNQSSSLILTTNTIAGTGSFEFKVSSESGWDFLQFFTNGVLASQWSGEVGWATYSFAVPAGINTFQWTYEKDPTIVAGADAAFLANVYVPIFTPSTAVTAPVVSFVSGLPFQLTLAGQEGAVYVIQASSDLSSWTSISTNVAASTPITITDPQSGSFSTRFYRAVAPGQ